MAGPSVGNPSGPSGPSGPSRSNVTTTGSVAAPAKPPKTPSSGSSTASSYGLNGRREPPFRNSPAVTGTNGPIDIYTGARLYRGNFREYYYPNDPGQPSGATTYHLDFFYNPGAIDLEYANVNMDTYTPEQFDKSTYEHETLANAQNLNTVSWAMIIDRTGVPDSQTPDQAVPEGVLRDVRIFEKILTAGSGGPNQYGFRPLNLTRVRFSRHGGGFQPPLNYIGYIMNASVVYTRFNIDMVPTRAEIKVTMGITVMNPELWVDAGGEAGYTVKSLGRVGTPLNAHETVYGTLYLPGRGTRHALPPGGSLPDISNDPTGTGQGGSVPSGPGAHHSGVIAAQTAQAQIGKPYVYGASGPNAFDCSGLTMFAWAAAGVNLPHDAQQQWNRVPHVDLVNVIPGDLAFYGYNADPTKVHHCGIVSWDHWAQAIMVEAPHTGANVRESGYNRSDLVGFARPGT